MLKDTKATKIMVPTNILILLILRILKILIRRALEDLNPRHLVLETNVLPTELKAHDEKRVSAIPDPVSIAIIT
jgi:hypothetical protein